MKAVGRRLNRAIRATPAGIPAAVPSDEVVGRLVSQYLSAVSRFREVVELELANWHGTLYAVPGPHPRDARSQRKSEARG